MDWDCYAVIRLVVLLALAGLLALQAAVPVNALSLKMQPAIYIDTLQKGEKKKGFVDISNPMTTKIRLKTSVQAFRQTDDNGSLQFYDDAQLKAGLIPDLDEFELGPREAVRMYFLIDGTKLPPGEIFASLFVSTIPEQQAGAAEAVQLGTLFSLVNGTPGAHKAEITSLDVPFWQFGDKVQGSYRIKNVAKPGESTGFFPDVTIAIKPLDQRIQQQGKLIFAGRSRENTFQVPASRVGFYKISVAYGNSRQSRLVFMATGYWLGILIGFALLLLIAAGWLAGRHAKRRRAAK